MVYLEPFVVQRALKRLPPLLKQLFAKPLMLLANFCFGSSVPLETDVGPGSVCEHRGLGVVLHPGAVIGRDVHVLPHVVLGGKGRGIPGAPSVGDGATLGVGCKILGDVRIGPRAQIGANAVVLSDVPADATAVGVPARVISA